MYVQFIVVVVVLKGILYIKVCNWLKQPKSQGKTAIILKERIREIIDFSNS